MIDGARLAEKTTLRRYATADRSELIEIARTSRSLHHPWAHPPSTHAEFDTYELRTRRDDFVSLLACRTSDGAICGVFNLSEIVRGSFQSAYLGYYGALATAAQGHMTEGMRLVLHQAFEVLGLHRVEANIQPHNEKSLKLARRCGFQREGFSPRYLRIGGEWRDHERYAVLAEDWRALVR